MLRVSFSHFFNSFRFIFVELSIREWLLHHRGPHARHIHWYKQSKFPLCKCDICSHSFLQLSFVSSDMIVCSVLNKCDSSLRSVAPANAMPTPNTLHILRIEQRAFCFTTRNRIKVIKKWHANINTLTISCARCVELLLCASSGGGEFCCTCI